MRKLLTGRVDGQSLAAVMFALVGCGVFLTMLNNGGVLTFAVVLSLLLAGAGYWSRQRGAPSPDPLTAQAVADAPPEAQAPPVGVTHSSWWRDPLVKDGGHVGGTGYLWGPRGSGERDVDATAAGGYAGVHGSPGRDPYAPPRRDPRLGEPRGIGGLFFDDFNELGFERSFALLRSVGDAYLPAYRPIVARRNLPFGLSVIAVAERPATRSSWAPAQSSSTTPN